MSVHAGSILHIGATNVIDRIQNAGLGNVTVGKDVIREVGNDLIVDKVPQEPSFTFTLESFDVSTEVEALITGHHSGAASGAGPDTDGTTLFKWSQCQFINIPSPWKDPATGSGGTVNAGHLVPGYYPTRLRYQFGVTDNARETVELSGGSFYYGNGAPEEEFKTGDGATVAFATTDAAIPYRIGGALGTSFKSIFGVIVAGTLMTEGVDYTQSPSNTASAGTATLTFTTAPASGADIRYCYFTSATKTYPDAVHASTVVKPGAVRGRNICIYLGSGGARAKVGSVQSFDLEATVSGDFEREFCNAETIGYSVNGRDVTGSMTVRSKNKDAFLDLLAKVTGVAKAEVSGWLNTNTIPIEIAIQNPKDPATIIKTLYVSDAIFQPPGTPAQVNTPTDFVFSWESQSGELSVYKGAKA